MIFRCIFHFLRVWFDNYSSHLNSGSVFNSWFGFLFENHDWFWSSNLHSCLWLKVKCFEKSLISVDLWTLSSLIGKIKDPFHFFFISCKRSFVCFSFYQFFEKIHKYSCREGLLISCIRLWSVHFLIIFLLQWKEQKILCI